jgi:hypothetical protein
MQELRVLGVEQQMWQKGHSSSKPLALPIGLRAVHNQAVTVEATGSAADSAAPGSVAADAGHPAAGLNASSCTASIPVGFVAEPADDLHVSPALLPAALEVTGSRQAGGDSLCAAKQSMHIDFGIMSLPALSFPGSESGGGVPLSKAAKAAGLRTS